MRSAIAIASAVLLLPLCARAQVGPIGTDFLVNSYTPGLHDYPAIASAADGAFVVVWVSYDQDGDGGGVFGQRFDSAGQAAGTEFQVNTYTPGGQGYPPAVASTADGRFVVVWTSPGEDGGDQGVFAQRYDSAGGTLGAEFQVNTYTLYNQGFDTAAGAAPDGRFIVAWSSQDQDGDGFGVYAQRFDSNGQPEGSEFLVNTYTGDDQDGPSVSVASDGAFVVTWVAQGEDGDGPGIFAQRYDSSGLRSGTEFQVNSYTRGLQAGPEVASAANGSFVIAWTSNGQDGNSYGVFAQRFDSAGSRAGTEFQVNTYTPGKQGRPQPAIAAHTDGSFVVTWPDSSQDGSGYGVFAQRYDSTGQKAGSEFLVNDDTSGSQQSPAVAAQPGEGFIVTWKGTQDHMLARRFGVQAICGNGIQDAGEQCDDGNAVDGDGCDSNCTLTACGNGIVTTGESCDDGNTTDGDGCSSTCQDSSPPESTSNPQLTTGETLTTDEENDGATESDPVETSLIMSVGTASASISEAADQESTIPGFAFFGQQVQISFNCAGDPCPSPTAPLMLSFRVDASRIPAGVNENTFVVFRDGVSVPACTGAPGTADPNPCVSQRQRFNDGDVGVTVLTSLASVWAFGAPTCSPTPVSCAASTGALLSVKKTDSDATATKLLWKWSRGTIADGSAFGDPVQGTSYALCIYDDGALVESHIVAPSGTCDGKLCWKATGTKGFHYKSKSGNSDGITKLLLKSGTGSAKILMKGKGASLIVPSSNPIYADTSQVTVQLVSSSGGCWQAAYTPPALTSTAEQFKDKL